MFNSRFAAFAAAALAAALLLSVPAARAGLLGSLLGDTPEERGKKAGVVETQGTVSIPVASLDAGKACGIEAGRREHPAVVGATRPRSVDVHRAPVVAQHRAPAGLVVAQ